MQFVYVVEGCVVEVEQEVVVYGFVYYCDGKDWVLVQFGSLCIKVIVNFIDGFIGDFYGEVICVVGYFLIQCLCGQVGVVKLCLSQGVFGDGGVQGSGKLVEVEMIGYLCFDLY